MKLDAQLPPGWLKECMAEVRTTNDAYDATMKMKMVVLLGISPDHQTAKEPK